MAPRKETTDRIEALTAVFNQTCPGVDNINFFHAPGRINLIGEHTDYNGGYVLPVAIDLDIIAAAAKRSDRTINLKSLNFPGDCAAQLDDLTYNAQRGWANYPLSSAWALESSDISSTGADVVFQGEIPLGGGLSSSAAIEVLMMTILLELSGSSLEKKQIPILCRKGENDFIGVKSGIMDQYIITFGKKNHALFLNCEALEHRLIPFCNVQDTVIIVGNTKVKRELAKSAYNQRVRECAEGLNLLRKHLDNDNITSLSSISREAFDSCRKVLPDLVSKRCGHVISENKRVLDAVDALENGDLAELGRLLVASHTSLRDLYEVSCGELDCMVESFLQTDGVYGARMTGAGFGGSAIALVKTSARDTVIEQVRESYRKKTGIDGSFHICRISDGAGVLKTEDIT